MVDVGKYTVRPMDPMGTIQHFLWFSFFIEPLTRQWAAIHGSGKKPLINIFPLKYPGFKKLRKPIVSSMSAYVLTPLIFGESSLMAAYTKDDHETGVSGSGISGKKSLKFIPNLVKSFEQTISNPKRSHYMTCVWKTCWIHIDVK